MTRRGSGLPDERAPEQAPPRADAIADECRRPVPRSASG